ncbi:otubain [Trypanosoma cruzi marinkellei]|uniref:ubiquitinyl hydrolase 1 n=1 Tax=Trypanosoma cruzi marinkellei TaxID=85056 RepID=K2NID1_TRYCR|nr:otubain [Trypanosoma cruzi marinkellei]
MCLQRIWVIRNAVIYTPACLLLRIFVGCSGTTTHLISLFLCLFLFLCLYVLFLISPFAGTVEGEKAHNPDLSPSHVCVFVCVSVFISSFSTIFYLFYFFASFFKSLCLFCCRLGGSGRLPVFLFLFVCLCSSPSPLRFASFRSISRQLPMTSSAHDREVQMAIIQSEIESVPLLSDPVEALSETCSLVKEFANSASLLPKVLSLFASDNDDRYSGIRYARRDGNCFFRCVVFSLLESMIGNSELTARYLEQATELRKKLIEDYGDFVEDFCDAAIAVIRQIESGACTTSEELYALATSHDSEYVIYFYRYAVSNYIRSHKDDFLPFVMGLNYENVEDFCRAEVDAVSSESDNVQVVAFARCFHLKIVVEYLDGSAGTRTTRHSFSGDTSDTDDNTCLVVTLLYRPGHYDLLYK